jgi:hypothetical protein
MRLSNLMALLALVASSSAFAQVCPYENLMPEFARFVAATGELEPQARAAAFVTRFADKHRDFYSDELFGPRPKLQERARRLFDPQRIPDFPGARPITLDDVLATGRSITVDYARIEARFRQAFADYRCETPISFGVSLYQFDGNQSSEVAGKARMRFGVDMIALMHPQQELPAFFHHELFHIYQAQQIGAAAPPDATQPVWWALWAEGLATYVSWKLNPQLTAPEIFWMPRDMETQMQPRIAEAARLMLADLDGHEGYGRWFTVGSSPPPGLPTRSGYYLGYLMAKRLDRGNLYDLARMQPEQVAREAHSFLESLAAATAKP